MKKLLFFGTLFTTLAVSSLLAEPIRTLSVTAHYEHSKSGDEVWKVPGFVEGAVSLPINFAGKTHVLEVTIGEDDAHIAKTIRVFIDDPAIILPGSATGSSTMECIFTATFPYKTEAFPFFHEEGLTLSLQIEEDKSPPGVAP
ncbi:MAG TPA: hypothetical protein VNB29_05485, partial [Chthoniobacterales bacterium]|nr:hypothetical protein [Chthoniobacterales bacterium]